MRNRALLLLFFASGATGLIYETVWTRLLILLFGSSVLGISAIVTAFLGGLALGGLIFGRRADRMQRPLRVYGLFEITIGIYAAALPFVFPALVPVLRVLWSVSGESYEAFSMLRFLLACALLLVPTLLMGASLPLLAAAVTKENDKPASAIGSLYGWNTLGAVAGTLAAGFVLLPLLGVQATSILCALGNLAVGALALRLDRNRNAAGIVSGTATANDVTPAAPSRGRSLVLAASALAGFAALVLELCWSRLLGTIYGSSLYGFCITLAAFLVGIAGGSLWIAKRLRSREASLLSFSLCEAGIVVTTLLGFFLVREIVFWNFRFQEWLRDAPAAWMLFRYAMSSFVVLVPTFLMGAAFPLAIGLVLDPSRPGEASGRVYGWNTLGSILGSFCAGFFLLPWLGLEKTILLACGILAALAAALFLRSRVAREPVGGSSRLLLVALLALGGLAIAFRPEWNPAMISAGGIYFREWDGMPHTRADFFEHYEGPNRSKKTVFYRDGRNASVGVYEGKRGHYYLEVNGKVDASSGHADMPTQVLSGLFPLLAPQTPREALVIGCGSGTTLGVLTQNPDLQSIDLVELEKAVIDAAKWFETINFRGLWDPRVRVFENDGRNHLLLRPQIYDLIISEPSNPWMSGASNLFTREFFHLVRERLSDNGVFTQWLQLYSIGTQDLKTLLRTLRSEFPQLLVFQLNEVDLVLVCWKQGPPRVDAEKLFRAFEHPELGPVLKRILVPSDSPIPATPADLLGFFRLDPTMAEAFVGAGGLNTDDNLCIESRTPLSLFDLTNQKNREEIDRFPAMLRPYLVFPENAERAAKLRKVLAEGFRARGQDRLAREMETE